MQKVNVNGVDLDYEAKGSGEPVLLIGTGPIADSFLPLLSEKALAGSYRLITYRQRRFTDSTNGPSPVSFAQHAADAAALLEHLGVRRVHVAGHSTGAAIALQLAVDCPDVVQSLALLEPPLLAAASAGAFFEKAGPAVAAFDSGDVERAMAEFLSSACSLDEKACREAIDARIPGGFAKALKDSENFFRSYLPALNEWHFGVEEATTISQPVLSVLGANTEQWFVDGAELLHTWFPQVEDSRIDGVAHLLHLQQPAPVARALAEFFARHPAREGGRLSVAESH